MDELVFVDKIRRIIKMRHDDVVAAMVSGGVDNMEKYQYMLGQARTYQYMLQEISNLLKRKEQKEDEGISYSVHNIRIVIINLLLQFYLCRDVGSRCFVCLY